MFSEFETYVDEVCQSNDDLNQQYHGLNDLTENQRIFMLNNLLNEFKGPQYMLEKNIKFLLKCAIRSKFHS